MRTAGLPNFRKLYGMISNSGGEAIALNKGMYYVTI
jgi:hypothetical protein